MSYKSDIQQIIREARVQGFSYNKTHNNHHRFRSSSGEIVITSGTPSAPSHWKNFLAQLKRAGFKRNAMHQLSARKYIIDHLASKADGAQVSDIKEYVKSVRPDLKSDITSSTLHYLLKRGHVIKLRHGKYALKHSQPVPVEPEVIPEATELVTDIDPLTDAPFQKEADAASAPILTKDPAPTVLEPASIVSKVTVQAEANLEEDLLSLDNALNALVKIEEVVKRNKQVIEQLMHLKKLLR